MKQVASKTKKKNSLALLITVFVMMALSVVNVTPVFADDVPPPVDSTTESIPPAEEVAGETQPEADSAPEAESQPVVEEPQPVAEEEVAEESLPEILEQAPQDTEVVVMNSEGEALPLASEEAAEILVKSDPWWCPGAGKPSAAGCTTGGGSGVQASFADLIDWMKTGATTGGTIWIYDYDSSLDANVKFDGTEFNVGVQKGTLTINGGWNGVANGLGVLDPADYAEFNGDSLSIVKWVGAVTLNNIKVSGATTNPTPPAFLPADGVALYVDTIGTITLNNVISENNVNANVDSKMYGAVLGTNGNVVVNNSSFEGNEGDGLYITNLGATVTVSESQFIDNGGNGLFVDTKSAVTTKNIVAAENAEDGVFIDNSSAVTAKTVVMTGYKHFLENEGNGLVIHTAGAINIINFVATGNGEVGVSIDNTFGAILTAPVFNSVTIGGTNLFSDNTGSGLEVYSFGTITTNNVTAMGNGGAGAVLDACTADDAGQVTGDCFAKTAKAVTMNGLNVLTGNQFGLDVSSAGGAVTLSNITASDNFLGGVYADNMLRNAAGIWTKGAITVKGYGVFSGNGDILMDFTDARGVRIDERGATLRATGAVTLENITANMNTDEGVYIESGYAVSIKGLNVFANNGVDNSGSGLVAQSFFDIISIANVSAYGNKGNGVELYNGSPTMPRAVTAAGINTYDNVGSGIIIKSFGAITVSNLNANDNSKGYGALLDNCRDSYSSGTSDGVCATTAPANVTLNGFINTNNNYETGLVIESLGVILANNITASGNGKSNTVDNDNRGVYIKNNWKTTVQSNVTINNVVASGNEENGLTVYSYGIITVLNVTANKNSGMGAKLDNTGGTIAKTLLVNGVNNFNYNLMDGLWFRSNGAVTLNGVTANYNDVAKAYVGSSGINGESTSTITLTCGFAYGNGNTGVYLKGGAGKLVTVKGLYAYKNGVNYDISEPRSLVKVCALP